MKIIYFLIALLACIAVFYLVGPKPSPPVLEGSLPKVTSDLLKLASDISVSESKIVGIKPDNEAKIIWADKMQKTKYAFVYIHGFSASQMEGDPVHRNLAKKFGANLYLSRLEGHGVETSENFKTLTADQLLRSARHAVAVGKAIGDSVVLIGTSMGGALVLQMAVENPDIKALVLLSPCIRIFDETARLLNDPWGLKIATMVKKSEFNIIPEQEPVSKKYWTKRYHLNGVVELENFIESAMVPENLKKVHQPLFLGYYYKDEQHQDNVVSVDAQLKMYDEVGSSIKKKVNFPDAGDHVIGSSIKSKAFGAVESEVEGFLKQLIK